VHVPEVSLPDLDRFALVVVDVQRGFDDAAYWGPRNNPQCEDNIAELLAAWRDRGRPVVFVRHDSAGESSPLQPGQPGNDFTAIVTGEPDLLVTKHVNSCFHGQPDLDAWLRARQLDGFVVSGITTNHCCETTARVGGNLGHQVLFARRDAHLRPDGTGRHRGHRGRARSGDRHQPERRVRHRRQHGAAPRNRRVAR